MLILLLVIDQLGVWGQQPGFKTGSAPLSLVVILSYFTSQCLSFFTYIMDTSSKRCLGWCLEDGKRLISRWLFITIVVTVSIFIISKERLQAQHQERPTASQSCDLLPVLWATPCGGQQSVVWLLALLFP